MAKHDWPQLLIRIPPELKGFIEQLAAKSYSSQSAEIIRALQEKKDRITASESKRKTVAKPTA